MVYIISLHIWSYWPLIFGIRPQRTPWILGKCVWSITVRDLQILSGIYAEGLDEDNKIISLSPQWYPWKIPSDTVFLDGIVACILFSLIFLDSREKTFKRLCVQVLLNLSIFSYHLLLWVGRRTVQDFWLVRETIL